jgi:hypothetical protein
VWVDVRGILHHPISQGIWKGEISAVVVASGSPVFLSLSLFCSALISGWWPQGDHSMDPSSISSDAAMVASRANDGASDKAPFPVEPATKPVALTMFQCSIK